MRTHISTVVGRYKGRIRGWDVVNEALNEDGTLRDSPWRRGIGDDYVARAFEFAHEADPDLELYYNDYNLATRPAKRAGAIRIIKDLQQRGIRIDAVGEQGHWRLDTPTPVELDQAITDLRANSTSTCCRRQAPRHPGSLRRRNRIRTRTACLKTCSGRSRGTTPTRSACC